MNLKLGQKLMSSFNYELWNRLLIEELKRQQEAWDYLMILDSCVKYVVYLNRPK